MKKLFTLLILLLSFTMNAQTFTYSGTAKVLDHNGSNFTILFTAKDAKAKHFIIKQPTKGPELIVGKDYYFFVKPVSYKGSKVTGYSWFCHEDAAQNTRERNRILDSIPEPVVQY